MAIKSSDNPYPGLQFEIDQPPLSLIKFHTDNTRWYQRLWYVIKLPYDICRWIVTGYMYFGHGFNKKWR